MNLKKLGKVFILFLVITTILIGFCGCNTSSNDGSDNSANIIKDEGFIIDTLESVGFDSSILNEGLNENYSESNLKSLLIYKDDKLVFERYFNDSTKDTQSNVFSVTKSFVSALIGIAIDSGKIENTKVKISEYLPEYFKDINDEDKESITIEHLLTMTPGFIENFPEFVQSFYTDAIKYTLDLPLNYKPGEKFQYANSSSHLLSVIIRKATGENAETFANKYLFNQLGIKDYSWTTERQGDNIGASDLYLRSRDMLKFGILYLKKGNWNGKQLISENWVNESTTKKIDAYEDNVGLQNKGYGYQWWLDTTGDDDYFSAIGHGGQFISVVKDLNLVVVATSVPPEEAIYSDSPQIKEILYNVIIPALQ